MTGQEPVVAGLVRSALAAEVVQRAAAILTEEGVELAADGPVLEGYVDLVYREDDGTLVVVDYKTDAIPAGAIGARAGCYRTQVQAYRRCLSDATGASVSGILLLLHPQAPAVVAPVG
ncbi:MAG TPA: PD-(D/E)XK nuclease family protein [Ruania sp.]|nr:PD-(D/E)XK nuclease family protein [Ruania sp.]